MQLALKILENKCRMTQEAMELERDGEKERDLSIRTCVLYFITWLKSFFLFLFFEMWFTKCLFSAGTSSCNIFYLCSFGRNAGWCKIVFIWLLSFRLNGTIWTAVTQAGGWSRWTNAVLIKNVCHSEHSI